MKTVIEPQRRIPVVEEADICVLGGSCTGVFAAVRAARLGARVVLVEQQNAFGGVACSSLVNVWHSLLDTDYREQIIAGLTAEILSRLSRRGAAAARENNASVGWLLNTEELKIELDRLVAESGVIPLLHTSFCAPYVEGGALRGVFVENKSGRGLIAARRFIDATGDGDLCARLRLKTYRNPHMQPPSSTALFCGYAESGADLDALLRAHGAEEGLAEDWGWRSVIPDAPQLSFHAETHVFHTDASDARSLTGAEIESRRQARAVLDLLRRYAPSGSSVGLAALPSYLGIRETRHVRCLHRLTEAELLHGRLFDDAVAYGTYRVDIHQADRPGIVFRYLNGDEVYARQGRPAEKSRWREDGGPYPKYYQLPYCCLVPEGPFDNLLAAGRMIDAEEAAFGAARVMVNLNQLGEAAGVAAFLSLRGEIPCREVKPDLLRRTLADGGSAIR